MGNQKLTQAEISQLMASYESELRKIEFQRGALVEAISKLQKHTGITEVIIETAVETAKPERKKPGPKPGAKKSAAPVAPAPEKPAKGRPGRKKVAKEPLVTPVEAKIEASVATPETTPKKRKPRAQKEQAAPATPPAKGKVGRPKAIKASTEISTVKEKQAKTPKVKAEKATKGKAKNEKVKVEKTETGAKAKPGPKASYSKWDHFVFDLIKKIGRPMTSADIIDAMKAERDRANDSLGDTALAQQLNRTLQKLSAKLDLLNKQPYSGKGKIYSLKNPNAQLPE